MLNVLNVEPNGRKPGKTTPRRTTHQPVVISPLAVTHDAPEGSRRGPQRQHHLWKYKCPKREWT